MDCAGFYAAFASTLGYHSYFEEYKKADCAVFPGASAGGNAETDAGAIVDCYEEVFKDSRAISRPRANQLSCFD